jgi:hypothetical protein
MSGMHIGESTMKVSELLEEKVEMCPKACCGKPVTECACGPDCKHCDCYEKKKAMKETTSAGGVASVAGAGFAGGGIGTLKRATGTVVKKKKKKTQ